MDGAIRFQGRDVGALTGSELRRYRNQVAMIFQDPRAHTNPVPRIGDFMTEALRTNLNVPARQAERRAIDMLGQVGIENGAKRLRQYPHELSGGMLQRVMIATSLLTGPRLLLADEPTTALDVTTQDIVATAPRLRAIPGQPLSAFEAPTQECAFTSRCPHVRDICRAEVPDLVALDGGVSRCVRAHELRGKLEAVDV